MYWLKNREYFPLRRNRKGFINSDNKTNIWLVFFTAIVAIASIGSAVTTWLKLSKQVKEMEYATRLEWRPFLYLDHAEYGPPEFSFILAGEDIMIPDSNFVTFSKIDSLITAGILEGISINIPRKLRYYNNGKTPLRIKARMSSTLLRNEWIEKYSTSEDTLVNKIYNFPEWEEYITDFIVMPESTYVTKSYQGTYTRSMSITDFKRQLAQDTTLIFYPYTYVEYEDFFGNDYNSLTIYFLKVKFNSNEKGIYAAINKNICCGIEKYCWDINIGN